MCDAGSQGAWATPLTHTAALRTLASLAALLPHGPPSRQRAALPVMAHSALGAAPAVHTDEQIQGDPASPQASPAADQSLQMHVVQSTPRAWAADNHFTEDAHCRCMLRRRLHVIKSSS